MNALAHSDQDPVYLDYFETTVSRDDARGLIQAYRNVTQAICQRRESGKREMAAISALERRLGVKAGCLTTWHV
jgi:hypothetical protein